MKHFPHKDIFFSTVFVFLVIYLLSLLFAININLFNPLQESLRDFEINDIIFSRFHHPERIPIDTNIFLVNIGNNNRNQIAEELRIIRSHNPKVIGLDATFALSKDDDSALIAEIKKTPQLVTANYFDYKSGKSEGFDTLINSISEFHLAGKEGYTNFISKETESTVRDFSPLDTFHNKKYLSFSSLVVNKADSNKFGPLKDKISQLQIINYKGNTEFLKRGTLNGNENGKFITFDVKDVYNSNQMLDMIRNKIVLMGFIGQDSIAPILEDNHFTPLNHAYSGRSFPDMYGVVIHANIVAMMMDQNFIHRMNKYLLYLIAFIICYIHMHLFIVFFAEKHIWFDFIVFQALQLFSSVLIVFLSLLAFKYFSYKIDTTIIILPVILSIDLLCVYEVIVKLLHKKFGYKTYFMKGL